MIRRWELDQELEAGLSVTGVRVVGAVPDERIWDLLNVAVQAAPSPYASAAVVDLPELPPGGSLLVRPDGFIAWRAADPPTTWARPSPSCSGTAEPPGTPLSPGRSPGGPAVALCSVPPGPLRPQGCPDTLSHAVEGGSPRAEASLAAGCDQAPGAGS